MQLGVFSLSLTVKDLAASRAFYEKLGFTQRGGNQDQGWLVMDNDGTTIGLFHGMFDHNILTFNPGWGLKAKALDTFDDIRVVQKSLEDQGIKFTTKTEGDSGPASFTLEDPDGNAILFDQHR